MAPKNLIELLDGAEAVPQRCSVKKVFLEISQNSQENICARVSFLKICKISKNTFSYRTPPAAASDGAYKIKQTEEKSLTTQF